MYARQDGYDGIMDALEHGWIRGYDIRDRIGLELMNIQDESTISNLALIDAPDGASTTAPGRRA